MKRISQLGLVLVALSFSNLVFAAKDTAINITFINNTTHTGNTDLTQLKPMNDIIGSIIEKNGGINTTTATLANDQLYAPGLALASGNIFYCINGDKNILINSSLYKGDMITVTYTKLISNGFGELECTCSGSACDVSMTAPKHNN